MKSSGAAVTGGDLIHPERPYDFKKLPYGEDQFDHVVFDPPYAHTPGKKFQNNANYQNSETHIREKGTKKYHDAVVQRYSIGMADWHRGLINDTDFKSHDQAPTAAPGSHAPPPEKDGGPAHDPPDGEGDG